MRWTRISCDQGAVWILAAKDLPCVAMVRAVESGHQVELYEGRSEPPMGRIVGTYPQLKQARGAASREVRRLADILPDLDVA